MIAADPRTDPQPRSRDPEPGETPGPRRVRGRLAGVNETNPRLQIGLDDRALVLVGEIDAHTAPELAAHLDPLPGASGDVVVDLAGVTFIDSSGLRVLVEAHHRSSESGRRLALRSPSPAVVRLLEISGLADHLDVDGS